jgi:hypothetical protein
MGRERNSFQEMKTKILLCALATLSACKNAEAPIAPQVKASQYESTAGIFYLAPPDLALAEKKAEAGDDVQLKRVIDHYMLGGDEETPTFKRARVYWIKVGAVRGIESAPANLLFYADEISGPPCQDVYDFYKRLDKDSQRDRESHNAYVKGCVSESEGK